MTTNELREEFKKWDSLPGTEFPPYQDQVFDWWLSKLSTERQTLREKIKWMIPRKFSDNNEIQSDYSYGYLEARKEVLALIDNQENK